MCLLFGTSQATEHNQNIDSSPAALTGRTHGNMWSALDILPSYTDNYNCNWKIKLEIKQLSYLVSVYILELGTIAICQLEIDRRYEIFLLKLDTTIPCECMNTSGNMTGRTIV